MPSQQMTKKIVVAGFCLLALVVSMYVFFIGKIVFDIVARRSAETEIKSLASSSGTLESEYYDKVRSLNLASVDKAGLSLASDVVYAERPAASVSTVGLVSNN